MEIKHFTPDPAEDAEITDMREDQASDLRGWLRQYVNDATISSLDLAYSLHLFTYDQACALARRGLEIHREKGGRL